VLLAAIFAVYSQVRSYDFVQYDDPGYITDNSHVRAGLTAGGFAWAFTSAGVDNWFPLTFLSHMADCQLFGLRAGWHHLTNVWLHALATVLLFVVLKRLTGARWPSAFVAMLFALHPLHVESVAWVAERKDVLSACFWCLTLWCYAGYVRRPGTGRYLLVLAVFLLAVMAKPMVVTLPFVLLLLDVWPLRRDLHAGLLWEKLPLIAISAAASLVTYLVQRHFGAVVAVSGAPVALRVENALVSYVAYIVNMFWPSALAVLYPYPRALPLWQSAGAGLLLAAISLAVGRQFRRRPYLAVGWCWYLGTLVPVIGLVQVGMQSRADRYTYLPMVGLSIMLAWGAAEAVERRPRFKGAALAAAAAAGIACLAVTWSQIQYWASSETLFRRATEVTRGNYVMLNNLAEWYAQLGRFAEAREEAAEALRANPGYLLAHVNLATALSKLGNTAGAELEYRRALALDQSSAEAHSGLGTVLVGERRTAEALQEMQAAVRLKPGYAEARYNLGKELADLGRNPEAAAEFAVVVYLLPSHAQAHDGLAMALAAQGKLDEALEEFAAEARLAPGDPKPQYNLGIALARLGRLDEAITHFSEALRLKPDFEAARKNMETAIAQRRASTGR
jgi:tetratricopeptide (TPR) repeat protein